MAPRGDRTRSARTARAGFLAGGGFGLVIALAILLSRARAFDAGPLRSTPSPSSYGSPASPAAPPSQTAGPANTNTPLAPSEFDDAERLLEMGEPEGALEILEPLLAMALDDEPTARLNFDIGMAEYQRGRFQRAAGFLEAAMAYGPTPERLYWLAVAYDTGGDYEHALGYYLQLAEWRTESADEYRDFAIFRVQAIIDLIGTPTPSN